ncbi:MAG: ribonuclease HII [Pyrinomonadaceae bacterium]|nr:ribonuclease HII [Pyrinomonadaceae bacterium]
MQNAERPDPFIEDETGSRVSLFQDLYVSGIGIVFEQQARDAGFGLIAGLDEVGRGCLAGPVVAGACILDLDRKLPKGLNDSKKLTAKAREEIAAALKDSAIAYAIGQVEADEIDRINILEATKKAMLLAIASLSAPADFLLIDALHLKQSNLPQKAIIKGDTISASIAAASIIAKTYRDALMVEHALEYPQYGFDGHKGYGAASHFEALREHGPCILHRKSFRGVIQ